MQNASLKHEWTVVRMRNIGASVREWKALRCAFFPFFLVQKDFFHTHGTSASNACVAEDVGVCLSGISLCTCTGCLSVTERDLSVSLEGTSLCTSV